MLSQNDLETRQQTEPAENKVHATWAELFEVLADTHPVRYEGLLEPIGTLYIAGARPIEQQTDALRFVHFIDKLYNLKVGLRMSGKVPLEKLFDASYAGGAYAKSTSAVCRVFQNCSRKIGSFRTTLHNVAQRPA